VADGGAQPDHLLMVLEAGEDLWRGDPGGRGRRGADSGGDGTGCDEGSRRGEGESTGEFQ
jgi:hypothetical protein